MKEKLEQLRSLLNEILALMDEAPKQEVLLESSAALEDTMENSQDTPQEEPEEDKEFSLLREILNSENWPEAVMSFQIADESSEKDKEERAAGICDIILPPMSSVGSTTRAGKKFLDFGCGEGHVAKNASKDALMSVGYDVLKSPKSQLAWEEMQDNFLLTTDFARVKELGPYDVILIYDVLDHVTSESQAEMLSKAASVLSEEGKIYLRCHPWCGRHGGHLYRKLNKAFMHLVFSDSELVKLGLEPEWIIKTTAPLFSYGEIIKESGLVQETEPEVDSQEVEEFFKENPLVRQRILKRWGLEEWGTSPPAFQMSQCFIDYILRKK